MKNAIIYLVCLISQISLAQATSNSAEENLNTTEVHNFAMKVSVDSVADLDKTLPLEEIDVLFEDLVSDQALSFEIVCNQKDLSNTKTLTYRVKGSGTDLTSFKEQVRKIRQAAINYYNN